jgi:hypothetical protein
MSETAKAPSATNGTTKVHPEIRMKIQEVDSGMTREGKTDQSKHWVVEVMCAVPKGTMEKAFICKTYEDLVKSVPIILTQIKEQFYAR